MACGCKLNQQPFSPPAYSIAAAAASEVDEALLQQLQRVDASAFPSATTIEPLPASELQQGMRQKSARVVFAARSSGSSEAVVDAPASSAAAEVLGYALYHTNSLTVHIARLVVAAEARRCGIGGALLKVRVRSLDDRNSSSVNLFAPLFSTHPSPNPNPNLPKQPTRLRCNEPSQSAASNAPPCTSRRKTQPRWPCTARRGSGWMQRWRATTPAPATR